MVSVRLITALAAIAALTPASLSHAAMSEADCASAYTALDADIDGFVTTVEGPRYFAYYRLGNKVFAENRVLREMFIVDCQAGMFDVMAPEVGAPFEGANSFTEAQARDRAMTYGLTGINSMNLDANGIWRGSGSLDGKPAKAAVDFKGNVVVTQ